MSEETAEKIMDAIMTVFVDSDTPIMEQLTLFGKIQNIIYSHVS